MTHAKLKFIAPSFLVGNVSRTLAFYCEKLGFNTYFREPEQESGQEPFFAIVQRNEVMVFMKAVEGATPRPNWTAHPWVKWDAYVSVPDPDALAAEFASRGVQFHQTLGVTSEGLLGFEVLDPDGYVLFFGRPK